MNPEIVVVVATTCAALGVIVGRMTAPRRPIPSDCEMVSKEWLTKQRTRAQLIRTKANAVMARMPKSGRVADATYTVVDHTEMLVIWDMADRISGDM